MGPGEFDCCLDPLAAGTCEERFGQLAACALAQLRAEHPCQFGHASLEHRGTVALEFVDDRRLDPRMIMASVVNTVA